MEVIEIIPQRSKRRCKALVASTLTQCLSAEYVEETIALLQQPTSAENRRAPSGEGSRFAERLGVYDELYPTVDDAFTPRQYNATVTVDE
ncbi:hypothetical protein A5784_09330 [Mycobacterium sp. 852013-50091_SCH5140682]|uniref:hypothetical protein n=1 Tax=Mycobacterium sp. 852013-50091_SCH5140682 TaxID=1834109 RepID=UPI0007E9D16B|nr:hypothetical protein [Mycobacterium sp. 852013-50091_SCH5140682]OBC07008.1 hypothetical protein A5784_09330 [Mycobacterium sp. 852013-50091_SCH5140682]